MYGDVQMVHGGTNFGFYNGANTGSDQFDYKPDLTSYDYVGKFHTISPLPKTLNMCSKVFFLVLQDAPIKESGDIDNPKFKGLMILWLLLAIYRPRFVSFIKLCAIFGSSPESD